MKQLTTPAGTFGPFTVIEAIGDRYHCDNIDFPFSVVGEGVIGEWEGPLPAPPEPPVVVPESVSPRQIRQALTRVNLRTTVEAAIAAADQDTKDWYEFATDFRRDHPMVAALAQSLNVPDADLDNLWILANSL